MAEKKKYSEEIYEDFTDYTMSLYDIMEKHGLPTTEYDRLQAERLKYLKSIGAPTGKGLIQPEHRTAQVVREWQIATGRRVGKASATALPSSTDRPVTLDAALMQLASADPTLIERAVKALESIAVSLEHISNAQILGK